MVEGSRVEGPAARKELTLARRARPEQKLLRSKAKKE